MSKETRMTFLSRLVVERPRPAAIARHANAHWFAVGAVCIGAFMGQLDASILTLSLPSLRTDFGATIQSVQWVGLTYLLVLASTVIAVGRITDMAGRKLIYTYGFVIFGIGSGLCCLAPSLYVLDAFRAIQALGAAMMQANSVAIIALVMPRGALGRGIGLQGAAQALGLALGPGAGGLLIALGGWRLIFFVNVPIGVIGTAAAWLLIPRSRDLQRRAPFDWWGFASFAPALTLLLLALSFGDVRGWLDWEIDVMLAGSLMLGGLFVMRERRAASPLIDLDLFRRRAFSAAIASGLLSYLVLFGALFVTPFFLEGARGFTPNLAGGLLTVLPIALTLVAPASGRLVEVIGSRTLTVGGMVIAAAALVLLTFLHGTTVEIGASLALLGLGLGLFIPANNAAIMSAAPATQMGVAGGVLNMTRGLGTSLGLALTALVFGSIASEGANPATVGRGFGAATFALGAFALLGAGLSAFRGSALSRASGPDVADVKGVAGSV